MNGCIMQAHEIDTAKIWPEKNGQHAGHRSPHEAGSADAYYGRECEPNFCYHGYRFSAAEMTDAQRAEYYEGYNETKERKVWDV